jgi:hypothetical protein
MYLSRSPAHPHETNSPTAQKPPLQFPVIKSSNKAPPYIDDETLPKKRGEYKEQNGRTHIQEDKRTT